MTRTLIITCSIFLSINVFSQTTNLSDYSYVVVPEQFDFLSGKDQYQINSMAQFYFEKNGFNPYMANVAPNASRCDGLFAEVEELKSVMGTKLQVVLKDCNEREIYRSQEGRSKLKDHDKKYQDALRNAFNSFKALRVNQKDIVLLEEGDVTKIPTISEKVEVPIVTEQKVKPKVFLVPEAKFSNYSFQGKTFLLRKTENGFSLYEESKSVADGLLLKGKLNVGEEAIKYVDTSGKVMDAAFDSSGKLTITDGISTNVYQLVN